MRVFFTATVHISSEATSPSDLKRVKGIAVGIETCERRKKKKREKKKRNVEREWLGPPMSLYLVNERRGILSLRKSCFHIISYYAET